MTEEEVKKDTGKYRVVILDTINQLMNDEHLRLMAAKARGATYDEWRDYGVNLLDLYDFIKSLPNVVPVQILGYEGSGKTVGGRNLNPDETYWLNIDKKPLSFKGARQMYSVDKKNYAVITDYEECKNALKAIHSKAKTPLIIFMLGHIEDYKAKGEEIRQRLKVLGKIATKFNIEGALVHTYYTYIDTSKKAIDPNRYMLRTVSKNDTARSPMGMWEKEVSKGIFEVQELIPNDLQSIVDKIIIDW